MISVEGRYVDRAADVTDLLRDAAAGEQGAWRALVQRYTNLLWSIARSHRLGQETAADVVQTCWLRLVENLGRIKEPDRLGAWLATTARHECLRQLHQAGREEPVEDTDLDRPLPDAEQVDAVLLLAERDAELWRALDALGGRCRELIRVLMAEPPPSYEEVAAALDMPIGSIGPTRARCLDKLRRLMADPGGG